MTTIPVSSTEAPLNFSRQGDPPPEDMVGKFKEDSLAHRILARANKAIDTAMSVIGRGPNDYDRIDDLERRIHRVEHKPHQPHYTNGNREFSRTAMAILGALIAAGIVANIVMYARVAVLESRLNQVEARR